MHHVDITHGWREPFAHREAGAGTVHAARERAPVAG
jgi:hypothetical protein